MEIGSAREKESNMGSIATGAAIGATVGAAYVLVSHKRKHGSLRSGGPDGAGDDGDGGGKGEPRWRSPALADLARHAAHQALAAGAGAAAQALQQGPQSGNGDSISAALSRAAREAGRAAADSLASQAGGRGSTEASDHDER
jgi:hypothetical protein